MLTGANSTSAGFFLLLRIHSPKISTSWKKIAQIYLPDLPLFASLNVCTFQMRREKVGWPIQVHLLAPVISFSVFSSLFSVCCFLLNILHNRIQDTGAPTGSRILLFICIPSFLTVFLCWFFLKISIYRIHDTGAPSFSSHFSLI